MKKYCIDYRNGGMGNTVLAHILYSSNQIDLNLQNFFSINGDAHKIKNLNATELTAHHLLEFPDESLVCVLELTATGWCELLRYKMSYSKWTKAEPNLNNYRDFFQVHPTINHDNLWVEFYNNLKDSSWPDCKQLSDVPQLPLDIQREIEENWSKPEFIVNSEFQLIEFLTLSYYDGLLLNTGGSKFNSETYDIEEYFDGNFDLLIGLSRKLDWDWDNHKSQKFYEVMLEHNNIYLVWLASIKEKYHNIITTNDLDWSLPPWEFSFILAKLFFDFKRNPRKIKWQELSCFFNDKSLKFNQLMGL